MATNGVCPIKSEYILQDPPTDAAKEENANEDIPTDSVAVDNDGQRNEPPRKKRKHTGQNKARPLTFTVKCETELCPVVAKCTEQTPDAKCSNSSCRFIHDVNEYMKVKLKDISEYCYSFETSGYCHMGLACRFASKHTSNLKNIIDKSKYEAFLKNGPHVLNGNERIFELRKELRQRKYDFKKTEQVVDGYKRRGKTAESDRKMDTSDTKHLGVVGDEDLVKLRESEKKTIDWDDKLYLAPLTTVGNLPFRRICKEYGADITCSEMVMSTSLLQGATSEWALVKRHHTEDLFGIQVCGNNPYVIAKSAQLIQDKLQADFVDINLGCPIDLVYRQGGGSGLLNRETVLSHVVRSCTDILNIPLTIKMRSGVYKKTNIAHVFVPKCVDWGVSMITIHGRSRESRYTKLADWDYVNECAAIQTKVPIFGSGDILSYADYANVKENYKNIRGVMIARGALIKPWIFQEIKEQRLWDIRSSERLDIIKKYANYGLEHWGSDTRGVENTRRFLLEWLSFLYRYVPVGLLEQPPQKINERPPRYRGRDELETLMASPSSTDWVKISEMLLGPVPDGFVFLPKHKANSY